MFLLVKLKKSVSGLSQPQEAAVLADEYILPHKSTFGGGGVLRSRSCSFRTSKPFVLHGELDSSRTEHSTGKRDDSIRVCDYCQSKRH